MNNKLQKGNFLPYISWEYEIEKQKTEGTFELQNPSDAQFLHYE